MYHFLAGLVNSEPEKAVSVADEAVRKIAQSGVPQ